MSRLDSFIRRMSAQRDILNDLSEQLRPVDGAILEFGLGSGRTFDHLREKFPGRRIIVFEREVRPDYMPDPPPAELIRGDIRTTSVGLEDGCAALIHADIDTGHMASDHVLSEWLPPLVARLLAPGGIVASSISLGHPHLLALPLPATVSEGRYFLACRAP